MREQVLAPTTFYFSQVRLNIQINSNSQTTYDNKILIHNLQQAEQEAKPLSMYNWPHFQPKTIHMNSNIVPDQPQSLHHFQLAHG